MPFRSHDTEIASVRITYDAYEGAGLPVVLLHGSGASRRMWRETTERVLACARPLLKSKPEAFASWNPVVPSPRDRDRCVVVSHLLRRDQLQALPMYEHVFCSSGLRDHDTLRMLVCDGPSILAVVGFTREDVFTRRDAGLFETIAPAIRRRLVLERMLKQSSLHQPRLDAVLEHVGSPAFILSSPGSVLHANRAGAEMLAADARATGREIVAGVESVRARLAHAAKTGDETHFRITAIVHDGAPRELLAIAKAPPLDPGPRARALRVHWGLTPRQTEVLALAARGLANKTIAAHLRCAEVTVELHMTAIFNRVQCESRAALVARFWTEPFA